MGNKSENKRKKRKMQMYWGVRISFVEACDKIEFRVLVIPVLIVSMKNANEQP